MDEDRRNVIVIGHRNPDTDSVCSAIAYAELKKQTEGPWFEACRTGEMNRETEYVLQRFDVKPPRICSDVSADVRDIDIRPVEGVGADTSMRRAWELMRDMEAKTQPIVSEEGFLLGISTLGDLAKAHMDNLDPYVVSQARTPFENILSVLDAEVVCGRPPARIERGKVIVGAASPELMETKVDEGDIVIVGNRYEAQLCAIEIGAALIVVCNGASVARTIRKLADENGCVMVTTPYDSFAAANLIRQSIPIATHMTPAEELLKFLPNEPIEDVREVMGSVRHRYFPICGANGKYLGLISRRNLLNLRKKQLILVDHNEKSQCVEGWEEAQILEVIDHHRIGNLQTSDPIYFINRPVGCTATIVYQMYQANQVTPTQQVAGLLLAAIMSDTLAFRSPTCTQVDEKVAAELEKLAGVDGRELSVEMFEAAENIEGESADEVFFTDFKKFTQDDVSFGVGQASFMSTQNMEKARSLLLPYLQQAREKAGTDMIFFMLTNIQEQYSLLIADGDGSKGLLKEAFDAELKDRTVQLPGVISRKKQLVPTLLNAIRQG